MAGLNGVFFRGRAAEETEGLIELTARRHDGFTGDQDAKLSMTKARLPVFRTEMSHCPMPPTATLPKSQASGINWSGQPVVYANTGQVDGDGIVLT